MSEGFKGMRFWMPGTIVGAPPDFARADKPAGFTDQDQVIAPSTYRNARYPELNFTGECFVKKAGHARILMKTSGRVRFDPLEAVKIGISPKELREEFGFDVADEVANEVKVEVKDDSPAEEAMPNFREMSVKEQAKFADEHELYLKAKKQEDRAAELEKWAAENKKKGKA